MLAQNLLVCSKAIFCDSLFVKTLADDQKTKQTITTNTSLRKNKWLKSYGSA